MRNKSWRFLSFLLLTSFFILSLKNPCFSQGVQPTPIDIGKNYLFKDGEVRMVFPSFSTLVNVLISNLLVLTGLILFIVLIFAGFGVILNSGGGNPEAAKKAKAAATSAAIGFFLVFGAYWLIQIVEFITGIKIFEPNLPF